MMWLAVWSAIERHCDHLNEDTLNTFVKYGIPVYSCLDVVKRYKNVNLMQSRRKVQLGGFKIQSFKLQHSCECIGFIIIHEEFGKLVFCTDCAEFKLKIKDVHHWMIECNYSDDIIINNLCDNIENRSHSNRHLELNDTINALKKNYSINMQNVILLHLSNENSNADEFVKKVKKELSFDNVFVAERNLLLPLHKEEF